MLLLCHRDDVFQMLDSFHSVIKVLWSVLLGKKNVKGLMLFTVSQNPLLFQVVPKLTSPFYFRSPFDFWKAQQHAVTSEHELY